MQVIGLAFSYDTSRLQSSDSEVTLAGLTASGWFLAVNVNAGIAYVPAYGQTPLPQGDGTFWTSTSRCRPMRRPAMHRSR